MALINQTGKETVCIHDNTVAEGGEVKCLVVKQVRQWEGAEALDGIDTLLVHLLADADSAAALESFAAAPNEVQPCTIYCGSPCSNT